MTVDLVAATGTGVARALPGIMPDVTSEALDRLERWVQAASSAHKLVAPLIGTPWVPAAYQPWGGKPPSNPSPEERARAFDQAVANGTAAVLYGSSLGVDPLMALQQVYVVSGRPGLYAKMMVALVQSRGHEVWDEDVTDTRAIVCGRRRGSSHEARVTITMDMARKAGWTRNSKYQETPQDMLWARAAARVCDRIASDVLKGIAAVEVLEDEAIQADATVGKPIRGHRTVTPPARAIEPVLPSAHDLAMRARSDYDPEEDEPPAEKKPVDISSAEPAMTKPQTGKLFALLKEKGLEDRELALDWLSQTIGRRIESTKEMTKRDAIKAIDALEKLDTTDDEPALDLDGQGGDEQPELEP